MHKLQNGYNDWYKKNKSGFLGGSKDSLEKRLVFEVDFLEKFITKKFNYPINILSVGCGEIKVEYELYKRGLIGKLTGIDISDLVIEKNIKNYKKIPEFDFKSKNILNFNFTKKYDLIFFGGVFMYLDEKQITKVLKKIKGNSIFFLCRESTSSFQDFFSDNLFFTYYRNKKFYIEKFRNFFGNVKCFFNWGYYNIISYDFLFNHRLNSSIFLIIVLNLFRLIKNYFRNDTYNYFFISKNQ